MNLRLNVMNYVLKTMWWAGFSGSTAGSRRSLWSSRGHLALVKQSWRNTLPRCCTRRRPQVPLSTVSWPFLGRFSTEFWLILFRLSHARGRRQGQLLRADPDESVPEWRIYQASPPKNDDCLLKDDGISIEKCWLSIANDDLSVTSSDLPLGSWERASWQVIWWKTHDFIVIKHDFIVNNDEFLLKHDDVSWKNHDFRLKNGECSLKIADFLLTGALRKCPSAVVLLDEFEKARFYMIYTKYHGLLLRIIGFMY